MECINGGLTNRDALCGVEQLPADKQQELQQHATTQRFTVGAGTDSSQQDATTSEMAVDAGPDPPEEIPAGSDTFEANVLRNMEWWATVDVTVDVTKLLRTPVRAMEAAPKGLEHATAESNVQILREIVRGVSKPEPWKALLMIDRLLFACPPAQEWRHQRDETAPQQSR